MLYEKFPIMGMKIKHAISHYFDPNFVMEIFFGSSYEMGRNKKCMLDTNTHSIIEMEDIHIRTISHFPL